MKMLKMDMLLADGAMRIGAATCPDCSQLHVGVIIPSGTPLPMLGDGSLSVTVGLSAAAAREFARKILEVLGPLH
jgi:hypothetical protein